MPLTLPRVELRKQVDTRAGRGLLIAIGMLTALAMGLLMWVARNDGAPLSAALAVTTTPRVCCCPCSGSSRHAMSGASAPRSSLHAGTPQAARGPRQTALGGGAGHHRGALAWVMALVAFLILAAWVDVKAALTPFAEGLDLTGTEWAQADTSGLLWIGIPLVIGIWRALMREVK